MPSGVAALYLYFGMRVSLAHSPGLGRERKRLGFVPSRALRMPDAIVRRLRRLDLLVDKIL